MSYRSISRAEASQIRLHFLANESVEVDRFGEVTGDGDLIDLADVALLAKEAVALCTEGQPVESVEHKYSGSLYVALRDMPVSVRDDYGFWRWVTLTALLPFVKEREPDLGLEALGAGTNSSDILACRMFLRGQVTRIAGQDGTLTFDLAVAPGIKTHDLWQSHILRRTTGGERAFAHALIAQQTDSETRLTTTPLRTFVRDSINRKKRTIATFLMDEDESRGYLQHERDIRSSATPPPELDSPDFDEDDN